MTTFADLKLRFFQSPDKTEVLSTVSRWIEISDQRKHFYPKGSLPYKTLQNCEFISNGVLNFCSIVLGGGSVLNVRKLTILGAVDSQGKIVCLAVIEVVEKVFHLMNLVKDPKDIFPTPKELMFHTPVKGSATFLMQRIVLIASRNNIQSIKLFSYPESESFYLKFGFSCSAQVFLPGVDHKLILDSERIQEFAKSYRRRLRALDEAA